MPKPVELTELGYPKWCVKPLQYKPFKNLDVISFDCESNKRGYSTLIGDSRGGWVKIRSFTDIETFLINKRNKFSVNFFFNLEYDTNAIIKHLPKKNLHELATFSVTSYNDLEISIIPKKLLTIKEGGDKKRGYQFFDIAQFYRLGNLEKTYNKTFVCHNMKCKTENCKDCPELEKYRQKMFLKSEDASEGFALNDITYDVILYCLQDCNITNKLSENFVNMCNSVVPIKKFYSPASLGKRLIRLNMTKPYYFKPSMLQQYALKSFNGGRIEVMQRGYFDEAYIYDVVSAYPSKQYQLKDVDASFWTSKEYESDSDHSFFNIDCQIYDCIVSPVKCIHKDLLVYPDGKLKNIYVTKSELELLMKLGYPYKINQGVHNKSDGAEPFKYMKEVFDKRSKLKKDKDPLQLPLKLALNSSYGVLIERQKKIRIVDASDALIENPEVEEIVLGNESYYKEVHYMAGQFFNPVWASEITSAIRCKLYEDSYKHQEHIIKFSTDSIALDKKIKLDFGKELGQYEDSDKYYGIVIGNGVYHFKSHKDEEDCINRFRSFGKEDVWDIAQDNRSKKKWSYSKESPRKLKESRKCDFEDFNEFKKRGKGLDINFDKKRNWERQARSFDDLLKNVIRSKAITLQ